MKDNIYFHDIALSNQNGSLPFMSVDAEKYDNPGAGGFFEINFENRFITDSDYKREKIQKLITVEARRFDAIDVDIPDLIAMDVQGAELIVLQGFGDKLTDVRAVIFESSFSENYIGGSTFRSVDEYLVGNNFSYIASDRFKGKLPRQSIVNKILKLYQPEFNCIYVNNTRSSQAV